MHELVDLGRTTARVTAAAFRAGVMPDACNGLMGAAIALGCPPRKFWARSAPMPSDVEMLANATDLEMHAEFLLGAAKALHKDTGRSFQAVSAELDELLTAILQAETPAQSAFLALAARRARGAIADCEAASEVTSEAVGRLDYAWHSLMRVPDDLASTYETPYAHVNTRGPLPDRGDFLTETEGATSR